MGESGHLIVDRPAPDPARMDIERLWRRDEAACVEDLLARLDWSPSTAARVEARAVAFVEEARRRAVDTGGLDAFMREYDLSNREGITLMCLAEALLRIPDAETADRLIEDRLGDADWERHLGRSESLFVNASTWALMLTGRLVRSGPDDEGDLSDALRGLLARGGRPVIRGAILRAMRILGGHYVMGRTIGEALERAGTGEYGRYRFSFDMLGEGARTAADAERHFGAYRHAIEAIGRHGVPADLFAAPGVSVKLSALHPRYIEAQRDRVMAELVPRLSSLAAAARAAGISLTVDAEEAERLDLSLDVFAAAFADPGLAGWPGFGLAVQAYQKRAPAVLDWLAERARAHGRRIPVRLVKGAYWDSEIKRVQVLGLDGYPVFTRKESTDLSFLACACRMLAAPDAIFPQFATHNAHTLAAVLDMAGDSRDFELQRLHGMGEELHDQVVAPPEQGGLGLPSRVYAPVGSHEDLLPYLVRRLLENGANTSFVNRLVHDDLPAAAVAADPVARVALLETKPHPRIPLPAELYGGDRRNSAGLELADRAVLRGLAAELAAVAGAPAEAAPMIAGKAVGEPSRELRDPADRRRLVGHVREAAAADIERALAAAGPAGRRWDATPVEERAAALERASDLYQRNRAELLRLLVREAGKTLPAALADLREAVDFLRYYAARARERFGPGRPLPGPTGEENRYRLHGRGTFLCISPWNFPIAIFTGQVAGALAAGNAVLAKPAEQTPLVAAAGVRLLHEAGVPRDVLQLLPGDGAVGAALVSDRRVDGVVFTGGTDTARAIAQALAERPGPLVPLIAETGGQNAMIVDSSALPEQVVDDTLRSAFDSAGQRCSALRVLFLQEEVAPRIIAMLAGAMAELRVGDPGLLSTDIGPVIDAEAAHRLTEHIARMRREARMIAASPLPEAGAHGTFVAPHAFEIDRIGELAREVFGPVLHVVRYAARDLDRVMDEIGATGYGLTLGVHSRIDANVRRIRARARVGNVYVNRNMIGATVGVQPFGGEGLSGTGPKAGGPLYLDRFATERVVSVDTTASGGNASLLTLGGG